jgi:hypothetical protein
MTPNFQRKHSSEPCIPSRHIGNGYGHFLDIDTNEPAPYNPGRRASDRRGYDKLKINIQKTPENSDDETPKDPSEPDKNNRRKILFIGVIYFATISFIALEYYMFYKAR